MPRTLYDTAARRKTVSVTMNADLVRKATARGINISRTAEAAVAAAFEAAEREAVRAEMAQEARIVDGLVARYGHPFPDALADFLPEEDGGDAA